jgi:protein CpxP
MFKNRKRLAKIVVLCCVTALTAFASIAQADGGGWGGRHHNFRKIAKQLGLTDAQKAQAKAIFQANKPIVQPIYASLRTERKNLRALMYANTVDEAAIRAETATISGIQANLNVNRANVGVQFRAILTPAQLATLNTMHQKGSNTTTTTTTPSS